MTRLLSVSLFFLFIFTSGVRADEGEPEYNGSCNCQVDTLSAAKRKKLEKADLDGGGYVGLGGWGCKGKQSQAGWEATCKEIYAKDIAAIKSSIKRVLVDCDEECVE